MTPQEKYLATARLGEGVCYTNFKEDWHAAIILKQNTETNVDLLVFGWDGSTKVIKNVEFDLMAEKTNTWSKTRT